MGKTLVAIAAALALSLVVTSASQAQQQQQQQGKGRGGGKGKAAPPAGPTPRTADGKVILGGDKPGKNGVWTPQIGITEPAAKLENVPFLPWAKAVYDNRQKNELEPHTRCKPSGVARQFMTPYGVEFTDLPEIGRIYIFDVGGPHTFRTIYMDGRAHPKDLDPEYYGHSVGRWEGDALVVDTVGFNTKFWMDREGTPHTEQLHLVERFTRTDFNALKYEATVDDPAAYTGVWTGGFILRWSPGTELFEYICQDNNRSPQGMVGADASVTRQRRIVP